MKRHAGLIDTEGPSIAAAVDDRLDSLGEAFGDYLSALALLNLELNGPTPSESINGKATSVPRELAYAAAEVARILRDRAARPDTPDRDKRTLLDSAWYVETAWLAVLAGDIDDLVQHLHDERAARD